MSFSFVHAFRARFLPILLLALLIPVRSHAQVANEPARSTNITTPASCQGGVMDVCGVMVPMPGITTLGNSTDVHVPPALLGDAGATANISFTVACVDNGNGGASYSIVHKENISCSSFPCPTSTVRLCDTSIPVRGGTPPGGLVHMTMTAPSSGPFTVQCIGNEANPPVYQIVEHSGVVCHAAAGP